MRPQNGARAGPHRADGPRNLARLPDRREANTKGHGGKKPQAAGAREPSHGITPPRRDLNAEARLQAVAPGGRAFFLECKTDRGVLSAEQRCIRDHLTALGTAPAVMRSIDDVRKAFAAWGLPVREPAP
jgi:hypothetical protein